MLYIILVSFDVAEGASDSLRHQGLGATATSALPRDTTRQGHMHMQSYGMSVLDKEFSSFD